MGPYIEKNSNTEEFDYELTGVLVHRGNPYGGHYFLVCKDLLNEANHKEGAGYYEMNDTIIKRVQKEAF